MYNQIAIMEKMVVFAYVMYSVLNETMELMKFSRITTARIDFQSGAFSPSSRQIDSNANFTMAGGFAIERTSTRCCFFIDFTAIEEWSSKNFRIWCVFELILRINLNKFLFDRTTVSIASYIGQWKHQ